MKLLIVAISLVLIQIQGAILMVSFYNKHCELGQCPWSEEPVPEHEQVRPVRLAMLNNEQVVPKRAI